MQNPSVYLYGPGNAKIEDSPTPTLTSPTDTIVRIGYVGVCGSDIHFWNHGGVNGNNVSETKPLIMGHEVSGTILEVGSAVTNVRPGDHVAVEGCYPCRSCNRCKEGLYNLCPNLKFVAAPPDTNGCLTKFFKISADFCYKLPERISLREGALVEPLAVGAHAVRMVGIKPGQNVVVFGSGTIGLVSAAVARFFGAQKVIMVDIADAKLDFAKRFLDCATYKPDAAKTFEENAAQIIVENNLGLGADAVIEASGAEASVNTAVHVLRKGGQYVQTGLGKPMIDFPIVTMSEKELHMHGALRYGTGDFETAMTVLENGSLDFKSLITQIFDFENTTDAWEATKAAKGIKNMIRGPSN